MTCKKQIQRYKLFKISPHSTLTSLTHVVTYGQCRHKCKWGKIILKSNMNFTKIFSIWNDFNLYPQDWKCCKQNLVKIACDSKIQRENLTKYLLWLLQTLIYACFKTHLMLPIWFFIPVLTFSQLELQVWWKNSKIFDKKMNNWHF